MLDWIGSASVMAGLLLSGRKNMLCWPVWLFGNVFWIIFGLQSSIWSIVILNIAFMVANIIGWRSWRKMSAKVSKLMEKKKNPYEVDVTQPPVGPPCIMEQINLFGERKETKESIERGELYLDYLIAYKQAMEAIK